MPLSVGDVVSVVYQSTWEEQRILLTTTWTVDTTSSTQSVSQDLADVAEFFADAAGGSPQPAYLAVLGADVLVDSVRAQRIWPARSIYRIATVALAGTMGSDALTGNVAGVFALRTDAAGRSQVANKHVGPPGSNGYVGGKPTAGYAAGLASLANNLTLGKVVPLTDTNTLSLDPVIFHKSSGGTSAITNAYISDRIGTMRRRTLRVGE